MGEADRLGREFLTWLWRVSEERGGSVFVPESGDVSIVFQKRVILESGEGDYTETVSCQGFHATLEEGKAALRQGKKVREARILMGLGDHEWEFTFKADQFQFQSVRPPKTFGRSEDEDDLEGRVLERISLMEEPKKVMERLFTEFLRRRLDPAWISEEIPKLERWASS